jgi:integrase
MDLALKPSSPDGPAPAAVMTIADLIALVMAHPDLKPARRADITSALRTMCRALKTEPECLVANLRDISKRLAKVSPVSIGVTRGRWSNVRNLVLAALRLVGIRALPGRYREPLPPAWEALRAQLPSDPSKSRVSRFMGFCGANGIAPGAVTKETFSQFQSAVENDSLVPRPTAVIRDTGVGWNEAADTIPGWPQLRVEVPSRRRDFAYPEEDFPEPFQASLNTYFTKRTNPDVFADDYCRPMSEITLKQRRQHIIMIATALVMSGFPIGNITSLAVLAEPANAEEALRFLFERAGGKLTPFVARLADLLVTIAKHHIGLKGPQLERLRGFARNLRPKSQGFAERNRAFLRQVADPRALQALLSLPFDLVRKAEREGVKGRRTAVLVEMAVAVALELVIPLRADDLAGFRIDQHLHYHGEAVLISITAAKNGSIVDAEVPPKVTRLFNLFLRDCRPQLAGPDSPWLFPGEKGGRRQTSGFSGQVTRTIFRETGIKMTMHQFRHLAAWIYLKEHPGDYETVRQLLGHRNVATTIRFYQELEKLMASRRYNEIVTRLVAGQGFGVTSTSGDR